MTISLFLKTLHIWPNRGASFALFFGGGGGIIFFGADERGGHKNNTQNVMKAKKSGLVEGSQEKFSGFRKNTEAPSYSL